MKTDAVIKSEGFRALFETMGPVEAERFIILLKREDFDYTQWRRPLWAGMGVEEISREAMRYSSETR